jgi:PKD repeat protein
MRTQLNRKGRVSLPIFTAIFAFAILFTPAAYAQTPPVITTTSLPNGAPGSYYDANLTAISSGYANWSIESGDLPQGFTLSTGGYISYYGGYPYPELGTYTFTVKAENDAGSSTKELTIKIVSLEITTTSLLDGFVGRNYEGLINAIGTASELSITSGDLPPGLRLYKGSSGLRFAGTPITAGTYTFTLKAENEDGSDTKTFTIKIAMPKEPVITTTSLPNGTPSSYYNANLTTSAEYAEWSIESGSLPQGFELYTDLSSGIISYSPSIPYPELGTYTFTVKATNAAGSRTKEFTIKIVSMEITTSSMPDGFVGGNYGGNINIIGIASELSITSGDLPPGLNFIGFIGYVYVSGTPTTVGTYTFTVKAENKFGNDTKTFTIKIAMPKEPIITTSTLPNGILVNPSNLPGPSPYIVPLTTSAEYANWSIESGSLPPVLNLWGSSISGSPTTVGTYTFTVKATNATGSRTKEFTITIAEESQAPEIVTSSLPDGVVGEWYNQPLQATWADVTWSIASGELPGLMVGFPQPNSIYGTPAMAGTYTFTLKAENTAGSDTKEFTITIKHTEASCLAEGNVWSNGNCRAKTPAEVCTDAGNTWENGECQTSPIRIPQLAGGNIRAYAMGNSIVLQNLPTGAKVEVFGLSGKLVYSNRENRGSDMSISVRTKGMYIVKVSSGSEMKTVKVAVR